MKLIRESNAFCAGISEKRTRTQAIHKDQKFFDDMTRQKEDAGEKGGLIRGSGHHYDRAYNGWD